MNGLSKYLVPILLLTSSVSAKWIVEFNEEKSKWNHGESNLIYKPNEEGEELTTAIQQLRDKDEILLLEYCFLDVLKDPHTNRQIINALAEVSKSDPREELGKNINWGSFHHPKVNEYYENLLEAILTIPEFKKLSESLAKYGLVLTRANMEKSSFEWREDGELFLTGISGIWLGIEPKQFGLKERTDKVGAYLNLGDLKREGEDWIGYFRLSHQNKEALRFYGRWSEKYESYEILSYELSATNGKEWITSSQPEFTENSISFRIKPNTIHTIRINLGSESYYRAKLRLHGPGLTVESYDFKLNEYSLNHRE